MKILALISFLVLSIISWTQTPVFPYEDKNFESLEFSDNGKFAAALNTQDELSVIDVKSGNVICSKSLYQAGTEIIAFGLSFSGSTLAILRTDVEGEYLPLVQFYQFNGVEGIESLGEEQLFSYKYEYPQGHFFWESNKDDDLILKVSHLPFDRHRFSYMNHFYQYEDGFYSMLDVGGLQEGYTEVYDYYDHNLYNHSSLYYDVTENGHYAVLMTSYGISTLPKSQRAKYGLYSYGIYNLDIKKSRNTYKPLFFDEVSSDDFYSSLNEGGSVQLLKYDQKSERLYGVASGPIIDYILNDHPSIELGDRFTHLFYFDLKTFKFENIIPGELFNEPQFDFFDKDWLSHGYDQKFENYRVVVRESEHAPIVLFNYNLITQEVSHRTIVEASEADFQCRISKDNKLLLSGFEFDEYTGNGKVKMVVFDLSTMSPESKTDCALEKEDFKLEGLYFYEKGGDKMLCLFNADTRFDFNFSSLPFYEGVSVLDNGMKEAMYQAKDESKTTYDSAYQKNWERLNVEDWDISDFVHIPAIEYGYEIPGVMDMLDGIPIIGINETEENEWGEESFIKPFYHNIYYYPLEFEFHESSQNLFVSTIKTIDKFDKKEERITYTYEIQDKNILTFDIEKNGSLIAALMNDGSVCFWNVYTNELVGKLYLMNQGEDWLIVLSDNHYYGTKEAVEKVSFAFDKKVLPLEYFELKYNRPDKVLEALNFEHQNVITAFKKAYEKRLSKLGISEEMLQFDFDIPYLNIANGEEIPYMYDEGSIQLQLDMYDLKFDLDRIHIWNNGVAINGKKGISIRELQTKTHRGTYEVPLVSGENHIEVSVMNSSGAQSIESSVDVFYTKESESRNLYVVTAGVSDYKDSRYNLTYAAKDAEDIAATFEKSQLYDSVYTLTLIDDEVILENLEQVKEFLSQAEINDQVIVFIAGHGVLDAEFDYYFASYDMDFNNPSGRGISYAQIEALVDGIKPLRKLLFMDTCHSGEVEKDEIVEVDSTSWEDAEDLVFRNVGNTVAKKENALGLANTSELMKSLFTDLRKGTGSTVISSAGGVEFAMESDHWKNGLFTYCMINGLINGFADHNGDLIITVTELQAYVQAEVNRISGGKQTPTSRIQNTKLDYRIW